MATLFFASSAAHHDPNGHGDAPAALRFVDIIARHTKSVWSVWCVTCCGHRDRRRGGGLVFVAVDHCGPQCIGLHAAKRGTRFEALEPIRQGIRERFGGIGEGVARGLRLRHGVELLGRRCAFFGIGSPSFVQPEGNGVAERFIRTLKENLLWVRST